jgi:hypothetical protein
MNNIPIDSGKSKTTSCAKVLDILESLADSDVPHAARLIAILEACGITDTELLQRLTVSKPSTLRAARQALKIQRQKSSAPPEIQHTARNPAPEIQRCAENPAVTPEIQRSESKVLACVDITTRATKESPSEILSSKEVIDYPLTPKPAEQTEIVLFAQPLIEKPVRAQRQRGTRLEQTWTLPAEWRQWAEVNCFADAAAIQREAEIFRDYWISKPGAMACKLDWEATWRNWARKAFSPAGNRKPAATGVFQARPNVDWAVAKADRGRALMAQLGMKPKAEATA